MIRSRNQNSFSNQNKTSPDLVPLEPGFRVGLQNNELSHFHFFTFSFFIAISVCRCVSKHSNKYIFSRHFYPQIANTIIKYDTKVDTIWGSFLRNYNFPILCLNSSSIDHYDFTDSLEC